VKSLDGLFQSGAGVAGVCLHGKLAAVLLRSGNTPYRTLTVRLAAAMGFSVAVSAPAAQVLISIT
jgi:hypothetical protein